MAKIIDNYILLEGIGQGSFGEVHKGRNLISKEAVAVKTIKLDRFLNDTQLRDMIINEIQALKKLEDQYIVRMIKMLKSANNIYLVYEFLNGGSLSKMLEERGRIPEREALNILFGVFKGFRTLHAEKIIHRNMNPNNLFFNDGLIKVKNFFCCKSPISQKNFDPENPPYAAPEIALKTNQEDKSDIFSLGLILHKMLFGSLPQPLHEGTTMSELAELYKFRGGQGDCFKVKGVSDYSINLLEGMLAFDPANRVDWDVLFQQSEETSKVEFGTTSSHNQSSNFDTLGQNFYISQQSHNFSTQLQSVQQQDVLKRRTTNTSQLNEFSNKVITSTQNLHISGKENNNNIMEDTTNKYSQDKVFAKTMDKDTIVACSLGFQNIVNQILDLRNQFQLLLSGIAIIYELEQWAAKIKPEICVLFLLKKAIKRCQDCIQYTENPDADRRWDTCKQKKEILVLLRKDLDDLIKQFWRLQQSTDIQHDELSTLEIQDISYIHNMFLAIAKQIQLDLNSSRSSFKSGSLALQRTSQLTDVGKQASFAIFLVEQSKQNDPDQAIKTNEELILNLQRQPYFKKLEEHSKERLLELLDQKLKE